MLLGTRDGGESLSGLEGPDVSVELHAVHGELLLYKEVVRTLMVCFRGLLPDLSASHLFVHDALVESLVVSVPLLFELLFKFTLCFGYVVSHYLNV